MAIPHGVTLQVVSTQLVSILSIQTLDLRVSGWYYALYLALEFLFQPEPSHSYKIKIINPHRKSEAVVRYLHHPTKFSNAMHLRMHLVEVFEELVPDNNMSFSLGYYEGQQHCKIWLSSKDDFTAMYRKYPKGEITLWCDGRGHDTDDDEKSKKRRRLDKTITKRDEKENAVDDMSQVLKERHGDKYDMKKLRIWARTICGNIHDDMDVPPALPAFQDYERPKKKKISDAISEAAITFANAFKSKDTPVQEHLAEAAHAQAVPVPGPLSPGKTTALRMKNYEQLRYLKQLSDDGILSSEQYNVQKEKVLSSLQKLD